MQVCSRPFTRFGCGHALLFAPSMYRSIVLHSAPTLQVFLHAEKKVLAAFTEGLQVGMRPGDQPAFAAGMLLFLLAPATGCMPRPLELLVGTGLTTIPGIAGRRRCGSRAATRTL